MRDNRSEMIGQAHPRSAFAASLTQELLARAGVVPGMRVLVLGAADGDVALLAAERVGVGGEVIVLDADERALRAARARADEQCFEDIEFRAGSLERFVADEPLDAVVGRFFFMHRPDPVAALRHAAALLRDGGRMIVQEWHLESVLWPHSSAWPGSAAYASFAAQAIAAFRRARVHVDMGLRLVNVFAEAGLPLPRTRTELVAVRGACASGYAFLRSLLDELPTADDGVQSVADEIWDAGGHFFLPLQVGAWTTAVNR